MYSTREEAVASVADDSIRVQYDEGDYSRIMETVGTFTHHAVELINAAGEYGKELQSEADEDSASRMEYARREVVEKWATAQLALSKVAFVFRIDGTTAYDRLIAALNIEGGAIDMRGL
jgi:hypothetical protein